MCNALYFNYKQTYNEGYSTLYVMRGKAGIEKGTRCVSRGRAGIGKCTFMSQISLTALIIH